VARCDVLLGERLAFSIDRYVLSRLLCGIHLGGENNKQESMVHSYVTWRAIDTIDQAMVRWRSKRGEVRAAAGKQATEFSEEA